MISIIRLRHRLTSEREKNNIYQKMELFTGGNNYPSSLRHTALAHLLALRRESWASLPLDRGVKQQSLPSEDSLHSIFTRHWE
ncbi:hypothetical protein TNCT_30131 [Trichonephila clavata]|uniref:Uncharacterized protein n=1 Tax=Trichonephila clavata TaxID=2740835 RepID=A0A8X6KT04_TRICU|nr:hypothetical protein TNCT_30131 [Trichonephila clavata]